MINLSKLIVSKEAVGFFKEEVEFRFQKSWKTTVFGLLLMGIGIGGFFLTDKITTGWMLGLSVAGFALVAWIEDKPSQEKARRKAGKEK